MPSYYVPAESLIDPNTGYMVTYVGSITTASGEEIMLGVFKDKAIIVDPSIFVPINTFMDFMDENGKLREVYSEREDIHDFIGKGDLVVFYVNNGQREIHAIFNSSDPNDFYEEFDDAVKFEKVHHEKGCNYTLHFTPVTEKEANCLLNNMFN